MAQPRDVLVIREVQIIPYCWLWGHDGEAPFILSNVLLSALITWRFWLELALVTTSGRKCQMIVALHNLSDQLVYFLG